jgi:enoyl-CoA hydratase
MSTLRIDREDAVAILTLNRPDKLNSLTAELLRELYAAVDALDADPSVRAAVLTGAGDRAFAAGADIASMSGMTPPQAKGFSELGHRVGAAIEQSRVPFIAAVNGFALGGGCELAMTCDVIYASDKAKLGQPEVNLGILPGFGGTQRLTRRVGVGRARQLCMSAEIIGAEEALRIGLVDAVAPHAELLPQARKLAGGDQARHPSGSGRPLADRQRARGDRLRRPLRDRRPARGDAGVPGKATPHLRRKVSVRGRRHPT